MLVTYEETTKAEIKAEMARQNLSQTQLAARLGWQQQYLSRVLSQKRQIRLAEVEQITTALHVTLSDLGIGAGRKGVR
ncbi:MAG TPA: helix-turn-helix transcriptional regulator [Streptosporangiaceae bacterium]|jgi:transcriptional regulator with XRE-family HTH domain